VKCGQGIVTVKRGAMSRNQDLRVLGGDSVEGLGPFVVVPDHLVGVSDVRETRDDEVSGVEDAVLGDLHQSGVIGLAVLVTQVEGLPTEGEVVLIDVLDIGIREGAPISLASEDRLVVAIPHRPEYR
jgi:hypothetical protein